MINVLVERTPADNRGDDIVDSKITTVGAAVERGRNAIDEVYTDREMVTCEMALTQLFETNKLIEIREAGKEPFLGLIETVEINISSSPISATIKLEVEREKR